MPPHPDPVVEARIQRALARYEGRLTPKALTEARRMLEVILTTHPTLAPLVERVRQGGAAPNASGVALKEGAAVDEAPAMPAKRAKKGRR